MKNIIAEKRLIFDQSFAFNNTTHRWVMESISNNDH